MQGDVGAVGIGGGELVNGGAILRYRGRAVLGRSLRERYWGSVLGGTHVWSDKFVLLKVSYLVRYP